MQIFLYTLAAIFAAGFIAKVAWVVYAIVTSERTEPVDTDERDDVGGWG